MYFERILHVDLSQGTSRVEQIDAQQIQPYLGGIGLGARLLYDQLPGGADPLGPENVLVFAPGPFAGTLVATGSKHAVVAKSPLTGMIVRQLGALAWLGAAAAMASKRVAERRRRSVCMGLLLASGGMRLGDVCDWFRHSGRDGAFQSASPSASTTSDRTEAPLGLTVLPRDFTASRKF